MSHYDCMSAGRLTAAENSQTLDQLLRWANSDPDGWQFCGDGWQFCVVTYRGKVWFGFTPAFTLFTGGFEILMSQPTHCRLTGKKVKQLRNALHEIRHGHHNSETARAVEAAIGITFAEEKPSRTEAEVAKLRRLVEAIMKHPVGAGVGVLLSILSIAALATAATAAFAG